MQYDEAYEEIAQYAAYMQTPLIAYGYDWGMQNTDNGMNFRSQDLNVDIPHIGLRGEHQIVNAGTAIATLLALPQIKIKESDIIKGIGNTVWKGRLESIKLDMIPEHIELIADGAHNAAAFHMLKEYIVAYKAQHQKNVAAIVGVTHGRDCHELLSPLTNVIDFLAAVGVESEPNSLPASTIHQAAVEVGIKNSIASQSLEDAIRSCIQANNIGMIIIAGSLYLISDLIDLKQE